MVSPILVCRCRIVTVLCLGCGVSCLVPFTLLYSLILVPKLRAGLLLFHLPDCSPRITRHFEGCCHVVDFPVNTLFFFSFLSNEQTQHSLSIGGFPVTSWNHCLEFRDVVQKYSQRLLDRLVSSPEVSGISWKSWRVKLGKGLVGFAWVAWGPNLGSELKRSLRRKEKKKKKSQTEIPRKVP